jgi:hypothetical protein
VLLASVVSILVVRSNLSIKFYHPTTSLSQNLYVMQEANNTTLSVILISWDLQSKLPKRCNRVAYTLTLLLFVLWLSVLHSSEGTFLLCKEIAEIARRTTQNELVVAQEKSDFSFNFNCISQRKAGKAYIFISDFCHRLRPSGTCWGLRSKLPKRCNRVAYTLTLLLFVLWLSVLYSFEAVVKLI